MGAVGVGAILFAALLLIVAVMVWQEARKREYTAVYVIEEVVGHAFKLLSEESAARLDEDDVRRILEWEVFYLQGLRRDRRQGTPPIAGSHEAISFIQDRAQGAGYDYTYEDIAEVLVHEVSYLVDIGAVGPAVDEEPP